MVRPSDFVVWLEDVDREDTPLIGEKAANLGEMIQAGFPVPAGFAITTTAYTQFLRTNKLEKPILHLLNTINYNDPNSIRQVSAHIKKLITHASLPDELNKRIFDYYERIDRRNTAPPVAIRSSVIFGSTNVVPVDQQTFLNVHGEASVLHMIREAWAGLFDTQAISYYHHNRVDHLKTKISLVVQKMVESETSGVIFTRDPVTNNKNTIVIEAIYGLGELAVQGKVTPDQYKVDKKDLTIYEKNIADQKEMLVKARTQNKQISVPRKLINKQKITDDDILTLANYAKKLEKQYYFPQDSEWAKESGKIFIVQTRPLTTSPVSQTAKSGSSKLSVTQARVKPLLVGDGVSPGIAIGSVRIVKSSKDLGKVKRGDILVTDFTTAEFLPAMRRAAGIVSQKGGRTSHTAMTSRQLGIPAIVGASHALRILKDGMIVTIQGKTGEIMQGSLKNEKTFSRTVHHELPTNTSVLASLVDSQNVEKTALLPFDGVGLLHAEEIISDLGIHPKKLLHERKGNEYVMNLAEGIGRVCKAFYPRPVIFRTTDFTTDEYRSLIGGKEFEPQEPNPSLGYRGAYRYISDPRVFELELRAIQRVREKMGFNNLQLMVPFVRTVRELEHVKKAINATGMRRSSTFKLFMMCEIPSNVILMEDYLRVGIDGVSIGLDDLTTLLLGTDKNNDEISQEFDERNPAVLWALEQVIRTCVRREVPVSICGTAPSRYPDFVEKLIEWGINSITVSPDAVDITREYIYKAEKKNI